jgi:hypothetical protein
VEAGLCPLTGAFKMGDPFSSSEWEGESAVHLRHEDDEGDGVIGKIRRCAESTGKIERSDRPFVLAQRAA